MPSMIWRVLGLDLNRSESTGTLARAIPWGRLNVAKKRNCALMSGRRLHFRESPTFLKDKSRADQSMAPALGASTPGTKGSRSLFISAALLGAWLGLRIFKRFSDRQFELAVKVLLIASGVGLIV